MPFWGLPTEEQAADLYRRIDQLIADIYNLIRSIFIGPPRVEHQPDEAQDQTEERSMPDLIPQDSVDSPATESKSGDQPQPPMR